MPSAHGVLESLRCKAWQAGVGEAIAGAARLAVTTWLMEGWLALASCRMMVYDVHRSEQQADAAHCRQDLLHSDERHDMLSSGTDRA